MATQGRGGKGTRANSRNTDPITSHVAARGVEVSGTAPTQRERCYDAVINKPGSTAGEIAAATGLDRHTASKRLPELAERGLVFKGPIRKCTVKGSLMTTWWDVDPMKGKTQDGE